MSGVKPIEPKTYNGEADDEAFFKFIIESKQYMHQSGLDMQPHEQVGRMSSFLTGKASKFYMQEVGVAPHRWTLDAFFQGLIDYCFPADYRQQQRKRFRNCRQGDRPVQDFNHELTTLSIMLMDISEREMVNRLWFGTYPEYQSALYLEYLDPEFSSYEDVLEMLKLVEMAHQNVGGVAATRNGNGGHGRGRRGGQVVPRQGDTRPQNSAQPPSRLGSNGNPNRSRFATSTSRNNDNRQPPNVQPYSKNGKSNKLNKSNHPGSNLSKEQRKQFLAEGKCFSCSQPGHLAKDCPRNNTAKPAVASHSVSVDLAALDRTRELSQSTQMIHVSSMNFAPDSSSGEPVSLSAIRTHSTVDIYMVLYTSRRRTKLRQEIEYEDPLVLGIHECLTSVLSYPFDRKCSRRARRAPHDFRFVVCRTVHDTIRIHDRWDNSRWDIPFQEAIHIDFDVRMWYIQQRCKRYGVSEADASSEHYEQRFDKKLFDHYQDEGYEFYYPSNWFDKSVSTESVDTADANEQEMLFVFASFVHQLLRQEYRRAHRVTIEDYFEDDEVSSCSISLGAAQPPPGTFGALERNATYAKDYNRLVPRPIVVDVLVEGKKARALLDSGSLADFMSTRFADQLKNRRVPLAKPLPVSLAVAGSRSVANYCMDARLQYGDIDSVRHFDILNLENYDLILGTPFLYQHRVQIGFNDPRVHVGSPEPLPIRGEHVSKVSSRLVDVVESELEKCRTHILDYARGLNLFQTAAEAPFPPLRAINHTIPLIDESKIYHYRRSNCPDALRPLWAEKRRQYLASGRWKLTTGSNAMPMLLLHKPGSTKETPLLRTVIDLRERNANTRKMTSQLPDIEAVLRRVAAKPYRSLIDGKDAYEQIRVVPEHMERTIFNTPDGTMLSAVMQQGDCNAGATYQALMNHLFGPYIGVWMDVYLDDIVIYSATAAEHIEHIKIVLDILFKEKFFLSEAKMKLFQTELRILGHVIDDQGIRMDPAKVDSIAAWKVPSNRDLLRGFLGAVGYLAPNVPQIRIPMGVLTRLTGDRVPYNWSFTEQRAFEQVKQLIADFRDHHRVSLDYSPGSAPVNIITDACATGIGGIVSQGHDWKTAQVASFFSAKLNNAQQNYAVHDIEFLAGVETMLRNRNLLQGHPFRWYTDHRALIHLMKQPRLSGRQARWLEKISDFDFEIIYIEGTSNILADALSRIYSGDLPGTVRTPSEYTQYDDPSLSTINISAPILTGAHVFVVDSESTALDKVAVPPSTSDRPFAHVRKVILRLPKNPNEMATTEDFNAKPSEHPDSPELAPNELDFNPGETPAESVGNYVAPTLPTLIMTGNTHTPFPMSLKERYSEDPFFKLVVDRPKEYKNFLLDDGLVFRREGENRILCIPDIMIDGRRAREIVIEHAHSILAHLGTRKTLAYLRDQVWWKDMVRDITSFCISCNVCKTSKPNNQHPYGLLNPLPVPPRPWDGIGMDFVGPLPESKNRHGTFDMICVIIDLLTGMTHLVPCRQNYRARQIAELVFENVYKLHGLPKYIVSDRDSWFTSIFWDHLHKLIGVQLKMSSAYHPETDGATERMNRTVTQMLRQCVTPKQTDWVQKLPAIEFAINSARSETTGYAPFFLNHGRMPRSMLWNPAPASEYSAVRAFAQKMKDAVMSAHDSVLQARVKQTRQANRHRRPAPFTEKDLVYVSTKNMSLPRGRARKLAPKFIGPFRISKVLGNNSFVVDLPADLRRRGIYDVFHASLLRIHVPNDDRLFPGRDVSQVLSLADKSDPKDADSHEWPVARIVSHSGSRQNAMFEVLWKAGDITWLPYDSVAHLEPLKMYFEALGIDSIDQLPDQPAPPTEDDPQVLLSLLHLPSVAFEDKPHELGIIRLFVLAATWLVVRLYEALVFVGTHLIHPFKSSPLFYSMAPIELVEGQDLVVEDPLSGSMLTFTWDDQRRYVAFAQQVEHNTYTATTRMPERYLTFIRIYNTYAFEDCWLPTHPPFARPEPSNDAPNSALERFTRIALDNLERSHAARQHRFNQFHRDRVQSNGNANGGNANSDSRKEQRANRRIEKGPYSGGRPSKAQRIANREAQPVAGPSNTQITPATPINVTPEDIQMTGTPEDEEDAEGEYELEEQQAEGA